MLPHTFWGCTNDVPSNWARYPQSLAGRFAEMAERQVDRVFEPTHVVVADLAQGGDEPRLGGVLAGQL